jgi:DNA-binding transcriptional ArsR family regulator
VWDAELAAGDIAAAFELSAATISSHLQALRSAGLVTMRADGNFRRYRTDRAAMEAVLPLLASVGDRWQVADGVPERELATTTIERWVTVSVDLDGVDRPDAFEAFVDSRRYSAWLGVPVSLRDGRFAAELEWGTKVRGHYEVVAAPELIAMRWDFDDDAVPLPGRQLIGYLRFREQRGGTRVEVHQRAADADQADFLSVAWSTVLGRLRAHVDDGIRSGPARAVGGRARRPKRIGGR